MGSEWSYGITHYDKSNSWTSQVVHDSGIGVFDADELPLFTDTSGGKINSATVIINAKEGHYIRDVRGGESGYPTKIDFNDRIRITMLDGLNVGSYDRVFEVVRKIPMKTKGIGTQLRLECEGLERHLQKIMYSTKRLFDTPFDAWNDLCSFYNDSRTTDMPELKYLAGDGATNELPQTGTHHFDWGVNEETVYNRMVELIDGMGNSGESGGVLDFFEFHIVTNAANVTDMRIDVFSSGHSAPTITIDADSVNTGETDGGIDEAKGSVIGMWGENGKGSLPTDYQRFKGRQQFFPSATKNEFAEWISGQAYPTDSIVSFAGAVYWTPSLAGSQPPASPWVLMTPALYYGENNVNNYANANSVPQYSPWTNGKAKIWENAAVGQMGAPTYGQAFFDGNMVLNDETTFQTWVDYRSSDSTIPNTFTYNEIGSSGYWDGFRVLVDDPTPVGDFAGTDINGTQYGRNICIYDRKLDAWLVKYDVAGNTNLDGMLVAVLNEGKVYEADTGAYTDRTAENNTMHWAHPWTTFGNVSSLITNPDSGAQWAAPNSNSALEVVYSWQPLGGWWDEVFAGRNTANYYGAGAWLSMRWPIPANSEQLISEDIGDIYGGGEQNQTGPKMPTVIDAQNMTWTSNGYRGFNIAGAASSIEAEDLGQLSAIEFLCKLKYTYEPLAGGSLPLPKGNFKMRAWIFDKNDHVAFQDFTIPFNDETTTISLPFSGFQVYRGRRPRDLGFALNDLLPPEGLPTDDIFEFHHIQAFCFGTLESYDTQGRYSAGLGTDLGPGLQSLLVLLSLAASAFQELTRTITLTIDALRFAKPLLAVTDAVDAASPIDGITLAKIPEFKQEPAIGNYTQLKNAAKAELLKAHFKKTEYDVQTEIRHNLKFGRFFYFLDDEIVDEQDGGTDNRVQLVAKHIEYSITKPINGKGGALRRIRGSRRFV